ncbi:hypothetical protein [Desulfitobacterium dichloroeliminans]|nr:hypothetical protein [Desulfitobacterium dichloroeliminans]
MKKKATPDDKAQPKSQSSQRTKDQETIETGSPEDKSPDDMEIFE